MHSQQEWIRAYLAGELEAKKRRSIERHVHRCLRCWEALQSATPRTAPQWTNQSEIPRLPLTAQTLLSSSGAGWDSGAQRRTSRFRPWVPAVALLGILAMVGALMSLSWSLGAPGVASAGQHDPTGSWSATATRLDEDELDELREAGWTCPVVESAGYHLASATGTRSDGNAAVHIVMKNGKHELSVTEVRKLAGGPLATGSLAAPQQVAAKQLAAESTEGPLTELGRRLGAKAAASVSFGKGKATLSMDGVDYAITSNLAKKDVERLLQRLVVGEHTRSSGLDDSPEELGERLMRGLSRLMVLDFD